ncbi:MAG: bifunctional phosphoribosylaminoimidazolecarboxamide formyltransferase/inosine monophosphate cyclohydrolase [Candidatus Doudnabacteria bacterium CG10_big_fil_rev_8_21_14_0_10_41_10]|uniref:Bifunctional purine biosynthesis protein PurH n=1 Tax=Candidatus Doudnabacteria bacterium CG10_big_fil_rev_8_21_14_0_10_41_10 TaxID=1974551 RepID=A0A2H0VGL2_9BACT|nr:MAG: bifunctional phosphoribosylaminoimidazolecarboxamide formyltransferase/inosine monophosphate cyclohydrolase [Candidatus Doudnabacteria bacterium CG10_big_fil_rev_8_21_14_0_10_41_10]
MPRALISVYDKTGIVEFARQLADFGWEIISTGGTYKEILDAGIAVKTASSVTGFPEIMHGRVKTLHPKIHGGILADRDDISHMRDAKNNNISMIDMVVINLYPFEQVVAKPDLKESEAIEMIDIGGPTMLRSAAKNHKHIVVVCDPQDYKKIVDQLKKGEVSMETKKLLALKVFKRTSEYDKAIAEYFESKDSSPAFQASSPQRWEEGLTIQFQKLYDLRYGENPHQSASFYEDTSVFETSIAKAEILHGKKLSYNNILDADSALNLVKEFEEPTVSVVKHTNPAGCAVGKDIDEAYEKAYQGDPRSAFGGIIAMNRNCTKSIAEKVNKIFMEIVLAPDFDPKALTVLKQKKNLRLLKLGEFKKQAGLKDYRKVVGGILEQDFDRKNISKDDLKIVTKLKPDQTQIDDMLFAFKVCRHVKSNAIVLVKDKMLVGAGAGQMSRVDSVEIAIKKAGGREIGAVLGSDAFFPFRDSIDQIADAGIKAIIQPGGSIKDEEVIAAADEKGLSMVFTGIREFRH